MAAPTAEPVRPFDLDRLGPRALRRAEPRASIAVAGAGCALAVLGALIVGFDSADDGGTIDLLPGLVLTAALVAGGIAVQARFRRGPLATGGTVAVLLGAPAAVLFAVKMADDSAGLTPIVLLSTLVWLGVYLFGPGRGRPAYLAAAALGGWLLVLQALGDLERLPLMFFPMFSFEVDDGSDLLGSSYLSRPDITTLALLSLGVGVAYVLLSRSLDRRGAVGAATPLLVAALPAIALGCLGLADELEAVGAGLVAIAAGGLLALHGATVGRRATTWVGGGLVAIGVAAVLGDLSGDDTAAGGVLFLAGGLGLVGLAHVLAIRFQEPHELPEPPAPRRRLVAQTDTLQVPPPPSA
jgi:hypothetical protein